MTRRNIPPALLVVLAVALLVSGCVPAATPTSATATPISPSATVESPTETPVPPTVTLIATAVTTVSPTNTPGAAKPTPRPLPTTEQECRQLGGRWGPQGILGTPMCNLPTTDAGQPCRDPSQCEGVCLADPDPAAVSGQCSPYRLNFGCFDIIQGGERMGLCVD